MFNLRRNLVYVARDIERALGMKPGQHGTGVNRGDYFIISNDTAYGREIQRGYPNNVTLVAPTPGNDKNESKDGNTKGGSMLDTFDLLSLAEVQAQIEKLDADVVVFQNTSRIERLAADRGWRLLNPPAALSKRVEEKISQVAWLGEDADLLPPHQITLIRHVRMRAQKFVLQFNHAHTGQGTHVIDPAAGGAALLADLQAKFPDRECRVTDFIDGPTFTVNAVAGGAGGLGADIVIGNVSLQITGLAPFTDLPFATVGNDWSLPQTESYAKATADTEDIAQVIAARLGHDGWRGLFGIDTVFDPKSGKTYLIEINARQPASAAYESQLQKRSRPDDPSISEAHIAALTGEPMTSDGGGQTSPRISGAQIVQRITKANAKTPQTIDAAALRAKDLTVIAYDIQTADRTPGSELFRIQAAAGIMETPNQLNPLGAFIRSCIRNL